MGALAFPLVPSKEFLAKVEAFIKDHAHATIPPPDRDRATAIGRDHVYKCPLCGGSLDIIDIEDTAQP